MEWVAASRAERTSAGDDNWEFGLEILDFLELMAWRDDTGFFFLLSLFFPAFSFSLRQLSRAHFMMAGILLVLDFSLLLFVFTKGIIFEQRERERKKIKKNARKKAKLPG